MVDLSPIFNKERLKVLEELALMDDAHETIYDRLTALAKQVIGADASVMSMVGADFQFFKSYAGMTEEQRRSPMQQSFCKHVVATQEPLVIINAHEDERVANSPLIEAFGVQGYLGVPLTMFDGTCLGSFCVTTSDQHQWNELEIAIMYELAQIVTREIDIKAVTRVDAAYAPLLQHAHAEINALIDGLDASLPQEAFLAQLRTARAELESHLNY